MDFRGYDNMFRNGKISFLNEDHIIIDTVDDEGFARFYVYPPFERQIARANSMATWDAIRLTDLKSGHQVRVMANGRWIDGRVREVTSTHALVCRQNCAMFFFFNLKYVAGGGLSRQATLVPPQS